MKVRCYRSVYCAITVLCVSAAHHYFGLSADRLGPVEASQLAVRLPNPRLYEHQFGSRLSRHAERVRARMGRSQIP